MHAYKDVDPRAGESEEASAFPPRGLLQRFPVCDDSILVLYTFSSDSLKANFSQKADSAAVCDILFLSVLILFHFEKPLF